MNDTQARELAKTAISNLEKAVLHILSTSNRGLIAHEISDDLGIPRIPTPTAASECLIVNTILYKLYEDKYVQPCRERTRAWEITLKGRDQLLEVVTHQFVVAIPI